MRSRSNRRPGGGRKSGSGHSAQTESQKDARISYGGHSTQAKGLRRWLEQVVCLDGMVLITTQHFVNVSGTGGTQNFWVQKPPVKRGRSYTIHCQYYGGNMLQGVVVITKNKAAFKQWLEDNFGPESTSRWDG